MPDPILFFFKTNHIESPQNGDPHINPNTPSFTALERINREQITIPKVVKLGKSLDGIQIGEEVNIELMIQLFLHQNRK